MAANLIRPWQGDQADASERRIGGGVSRRRVLQSLGRSVAGLGIAGIGWEGLGGSCAPWVPTVAAQLASSAQQRRCILLWMNGGPSQIDTFDMKPGHSHGGEFRERSTSVPGLRFSEHLPLLAQQAERLAIVRSLTTKEGDHARGAHLVRTGRSPTGDVAYPSIACALAHELSAGNPGPSAPLLPHDSILSHDLVLPHYVSVAPQLELSPAAFGPGFLGARDAPALVSGNSSPEPLERPVAERSVAEGHVAELKLEHATPGAEVGTSQWTRRMEIWNALQRRALADGAPSFATHDAIYRKAIDMMRPEVRDAFDLSQESDAVRSKYGRGVFGQGCLLARRLVERNVPMVEVALGGGLAWDTHQDNFAQVRRLSAELDAGWSALMDELENRGLLATTTILWLGEFGRTPQINPNAGRDHFPNAWTCVFSGGNIAGGQAYGRTSDDGTTIEEDKVEIGDVLATLCAALGVDPAHENVTPSARPVKLAEGKPIEDLLI